MAKIKVVVASGVDFASATKASLGMSIREFARRHGVHESAVSALINGSTPYPHDRIRDALASELGVEREWIDEQLAAVKKGEGADAGADDRSVVAVPA